MQDFAKIGLIVVIAVLVIGVGAIILSGMRTLSLEHNQCWSTNELVTTGFSNGSTNTTAYRPINSGSETLFNTTTAGVVPFQLTRDSNYTINYLTGSLYFWKVNTTCNSNASGSLCFNSTVLYANYTYACNQSSIGTAAIDQLFTGLGELPRDLGLLIAAFVAVYVISIIRKSLGGGMA